MPLPEPEFVMFEYANTILKCHREQMQFLIFEGHLPAYVISPPELFDFWGVKNDHPFMCRCKPPFEWKVVDAQDGLSFLWLAVSSTTSGEEQDFPPPYDTVDVNGSPTTRWWFQEKQLIFKMSDVKNLIENNSIDLPKDDKVLTANTSPETNEPPKPAAQNFFTREGDIWHIGFMGKDARIKHINGLLYICYILQETRGSSISCKELCLTASWAPSNKPMSEGAAIDDGLNVGNSSKQDITDNTAKKKYLERYKKLQGDVEKAGDSPEDRLIAQEAEKEMGAILQAMNVKSFKNTDDVRSQSNVKRRLDNAYNAIRVNGMNGLACHLMKCIVSDGSYGLKYTGTHAWVTIA